MIVGAPSATVPKINASAGFAMMAAAVFARGPRPATADALSRRDRGPGEVEFGLVELRLCLLDLAFELFHLRFGQLDLRFRLPECGRRLIDVLLRRGWLPQADLAVIIGLRFREVRLGAFKLRLCLFEQSGEVLFGNLRGELLPGILGLGSRQRTFGLVPTVFVLARIDVDQVHPDHLPAPLLLDRSRPPDRDRGRTR